MKNRLKEMNVNNKVTLFCSIIGIVAGVISLTMDIIRPVEALLALGIAPVCMIFAFVSNMYSDKKCWAISALVFIGVYFTVVAAIYLIIYWNYIPISIY